MTNAAIPKDSVIMFLDAINHEDFKLAKNYLAGDVFFDGVMGKRNGAHDYMSDMEKMKFKYDIQKIFADENDVVVLYNINMGKVTIFTVGIYHVEGGKIKTIQVVFDPRPLL